ncbi:mCG146157, partial [Mus musculus]
SAMSWPETVRWILQGKCFPGACHELDLRYWEINRRKGFQRTSMKCWPIVYLTLTRAPKTVCAQTGIESMVEGYRGWRLVSPDNCCNRNGGSLRNTCEGFSLWSFPSLRND